jgi:hypothetical protein
MPRRSGGDRSNQNFKRELDPVVRARLDSIPYATKFKLLDANKEKINWSGTTGREKIEQSRTDKLTEFQKWDINYSFLKLFPDAIIREL